MRFSNDGTTWSTWESFAVTKSWTLSENNGTKYVYYQSKDEAGVIQDAVNDTIIRTKVKVIGYTVSKSRGNIGEDIIVDVSLSYDYDNSIVKSGTVTINEAEADYLLPIVIGAITVGDEPCRVSVNPTTNKIYVPINSEDKVYVIEGTTDTVTSIISVGNWPIGSCVNPTTNKIYVGNSGDDTVSVIDGSTNTVIKTIQVGISPYSLDVNPTTNKIYVVHSGNNLVVVIDGSTDTVSTTITLGGSSTNVGVNYNTNKIYATVSSENKVYVIDGSTDTVISTMTVGDKPIRLSVHPSTNKIYIAHSDEGTLSVIDGSSNTVTATLSVGNGARGVSINPTTNNIYVSSYSEDTIYVIDGSTNAIVTTLTGLTSCRNIGVNPNTNKIYVSCGHTEVFILSDKSGGIWRVTEKKSSVQAVTYDTVTVSSDTHGFVLVDQNNQSARVIWDQIEVVSVGFSDNHVNVRDEVEVQYTLRYDYDDESFTSDNGSVTISGSAASYDEVNGWWERTFAQSSNATSTYYDETEITFIDTVYGLTAIEDGAGANLVTDRIVVYWEELNDSRVNVGDSIEWHVRAVLDYDDHVLGAGDSLSSNLGALSWDEVNEWWDVTRSEEIVAGVAIGGWTGSEATYGVTAITENITEITGIWDRVVVQGYSVSDSRASVGDDVTVDVTLVYDYDESPVMEGSVETKGIEYALDFPNVIKTVTVGDSPWAVGINNITNKIYVPSENDDKVTVIDGSTDTVITTISVGDHPKGVGVNPNTNKIYVGDWMDDTVSVIDGSTDTVIATIASIGNIMEVGVNPTTNKIYIAHWSQYITVIDGSTDTVTATITVGNSHRGVGINPSTNKIYITNEYADKISVIDGSTDTVTATIFVGDHPYSVVVNPITNRIYVPNYDDNTVSVIDGSTDTVITTISVGEGPYCVDANPNTNKIYVGNRIDGTVSVIDGYTNIVSATIIAVTNPRRFGVNPNTNKIYLADDRVDIVSVISDKGDGVWSITERKDSVQTVTYDPVTVSGNTYGITQVDQNSQSAQVVWDQMEFVSVGFSDSRVSVGDEVEVRYTLQYDYDDVTFTGENGSVTISGSAASYDSVNGWWERTFAQSSSVTSTNYDENDITYTDTVYGLTAIEDDAGVNLVTDSIMVYWEELSDSRVNLGDDIEWRVRAVLEYDDHDLGSGDILSCSWGPLSWDETNEWWEITRSEDTVSGVTIGGWSGSEATQGITAVAENITETTGIWDRIQVQGYTVSDSRTDVGDDVNVDVTLVYEYDDSPLADGTVIITSPPEMQPTVKWSSTFGGPEYDVGYSVQETRRV